MDWRWIAHQPLVIVGAALVGTIVERVCVRMSPRLFPKGVRWGFMHWLLIAIVADAVYVGVHFTLPPP